MRTQTIFLSCLIIGVLQSCLRVNENEGINNQLIKLDVVFSDSCIQKYSSIFSGIEKVNLETAADCFIGNILSVRIIDNDIYIIHEISSNKELFRFSRNGYFLNSIGSNFKGAGVSINPRDVYIDNDIVEVWSRLDISEFSKEGKFIRKTFDAYCPGVGFFKKNGFYYLFHSAAPSYMLTRHNKNGALRGRFLPYNHFPAESINDKTIIFDTNEVSLFCSVCDTIFTFTNGSVKPKAYFNFIGVASAPNVFYKTESIFEFVKCLKNVCIVTNYFENLNYILFEFSFNSKVNYCLYDKKAKTSTYFDNKIIDDLTGTIFTAPVYLTEDDCLVMASYNSELNTSYKNIEIYTNAKQVNKNPVLLFFKIKTSII